MTEDPRGSGSSAAVRKETTPRTIDPADPMSAFGKIVLEMGLASPAEVEEAIRLQGVRSKGGDFVRLGQLFVERGILTPEQVREVLRRQNLRIRVCRRCHAQFNWIEGAPAVDDRGGSVPLPTSCPRCGGELEEPNRIVSTAVEDTLDRTKTGPLPPRMPGERTKIFGPYEIIGEISRGGMGIVYKSREIELDRIVATKILLPGGESPEEDVDRFVREARAVARLHHPAIVKIHRIGVHDSIHYFSMDFVPGISLDQIIDEGKVGLRPLVEIVAQIADAVEYAHANGVLHRDLKPSNILVTPALEPFLIDFGIAKFKNDRSELTRRGTLLGSPQYLAPEYITGESGAFDARSDVYGLGVTLYKVLSRGRLPYPDGDTIQVLRCILMGPAPDIESGLAELPRDLVAICGKAIERRPKDRYPSPGALAADLRAYLSGQEVTVRPRGRLHRLKRWLLHRASLAANVGLLLSLVLVLWLLHAAARDAANRASDRERELGEEEMRSRRLLYDLYLERARRIALEGNSERALDQFDQAIGIDPRRADAYSFRADLLDRLGRTNEAAYDRAKARDLESGR